MHQTNQMVLLSAYFSKERQTKIGWEKEQN